MDSITASLQRSTFERGGHCHRGEPCHSVIVDDKDLSQRWVFDRPLTGQYTANPTGILIESRSSAPRPLRAIQRHVDVDKAWPQRNKVFRRQTKMVQIARPAIGEKYVRSPKQSLES